MRSSHHCLLALLAALTPLAATTLCIIASPVAAVESGPQGVVRQFCQADALGQRITIPGWVALAPLVAWRFEPAWDHVVLITAYSVGAPQAAEGGAVTVEVQYSVAGDVSPLGFDPMARVETVTFQVRALEQHWRIDGPPPPPHVFGNRVDVDEMRRSLEQGGVNFVADSVFVWQMFHSVGWNVDFQRTVDFLSGRSYRALDRPKPGDIVLYLRDGLPYHVGLLEAANQVVSSTLNAGLVRTPIDAFDGTVQYMRLVQPEAAVDAPAQLAPTAPEAVVPTPAANAAPPRAASPIKPRSPQRPTPKPSSRRRVHKRVHKAAKAAKKAPKPRHRPTPVATRGPE